MDPRLNAINRPAARICRVRAQAAQTHVTRKGCAVIYLPWVTRDLSARRVGVALHAAVENKRLWR